VFASARGWQSARPARAIARPRHLAFKGYETGHLYFGVKCLPQMAEESLRRYLFVRTTGRPCECSSALQIQDCGQGLQLSARVGTRRPAAHSHNAPRRWQVGRRPPVRIAQTRGNWQERVRSIFASLGIKHRLAPPQHPPKKGLVERFNGRIGAALQSHHFHSGKRGSGDHAGGGRCDWR
jgi:hypothetical protein